MGQFADLIIPGLFKAGGSTLEGLFASNPFQERHSMLGTSADPIAGLTYAQNVLKGILGGQVAKLGEGVTLPDAHVGSDIPSFSGGGLPFPIGVTSAANSGHADLTKPHHLPGLGMDTDFGSLNHAVYGDVNPHDNNDAGTNVPRSNKGTDTTSSDDVSFGRAPGNGPPNVRTASVGNSPSTISAGVPSPSAPGLDPQTTGALQLLFHAAMPTQPREKLPLAA